MYGIFGNGQVAQHIAFALDKLKIKNELIGRGDKVEVERYRNTENTFNVEVASSKHLRDISRNYDVIIYTSSLRDVNACEKNPALAHRVNAYAPSYLSEQTKVIYISTDYVFGKLSANYPRPVSGKIGEGEDPDSKYFSGGAVSIYGHTKRQGEVAVLKNSGAVVRISSPFGRWKSPLRGSFVDLVSSSQEHMFLPVDQIVSPTYLPEAADVLASVDIKEMDGIYHLVNEGSGSYFDIGTWARSTIRNRKKVSMRYSEQELDKLRPNFSALQNNRLPKLSHWAEAVAKHLKGTIDE